jgi:hypothetical protein
MSTLVVPVMMDTGTTPKINSTYRSSSEMARKLMIIGGNKKGRWQLTLPFLFDY